MLTYLLFAAGFPLLVGGAHLLVEGASSIAKRLHVSDLVIGLTIVSLGTSAPEFVISFASGLIGANDLALGNVVGSNISNSLLILGCAALIRPLVVRDVTRRVELPFMLFVTAMLFALCNNFWLGDPSSRALGRIDGLVLLALFFLFTRYTVRAARRDRKSRPTELPKTRGVPASVAMVLIGSFALSLGGDWIVEGAVELARAMGLSEALIGLTILALGSSLPELAASVVAAYKGSADIAVGNVVGSNILNVVWILGVAATVRPLGFNALLNTDLLVLLGVTLGLFLAAGVFRRSKLSRGEGALGVALYVAYVGFLIWRG